MTADPPPARAFTSTATAADTPPPAAPVWRIDRFDLPETARDAVLARLRLTQAELGHRAGCLVNSIVEAPARDGRLEMLTLVAWRDEAALADARRHMQRVHAETGFGAAAFLERHGVTMTPAVYRGLDDTDLVA